MAQSQILELIKNNPGITQKALPDLADINRVTVSENVRKLSLKKDILRIWEASGQTYKLYANEEK